MTQLKSTLKVLILAVFGFGLTTAGISQDNDFGFGQQDPTQQQDPLQDPLSNPLAGFGAQNNEPRADFDSKFVVRKGTNRGVLSITGKPDLFSHSHIYSQRDDLEFHVPTVFTVLEGQNFKITGKFVSDIQPEFVQKEVNGQNWETEEFSTNVTWSAPIEFAENIDVQKLEIKTKIEGQVCNAGGCLPYENLIVTAKFDSFLEAGPYRVAKPIESSKVEWAGKVSTTKVKPGDSFTVSFTAKVDDKWHIYGLPLIKGQKDYSPTVIAFTNKGSLTAGPTTPSVEPSEKDMKKSVQLHHEGEVTFTTEFQVPEDAGKGPITVLGKLGFQTCNEAGSCKKPSAADFQFEMRVTTETDSVEQPIIIGASGSNYTDVLKIAQKADKKKTKGKEPFVLSTFLWYCGISFLAGLILNVMPCVLPVIGLKMMSFIEQAGENRGRIFALNVAFSLGLMSVFWLLGFLVVIMDFGWGDLLNKGLTGVIIASGIVFAFGLSMMGVWEIPIPGFASSTHASKMAEKEGLGGAFVKGILTTVLATPCVGPMLIPAMTFAVSQSSFVGFAIFTVLGIGMAFPFLLVAVFPGAIKFLPKPGAWMDTFKQVMGFVLIGTVLFLLSTFAKPSEQNTPYVLPVMFMLLVISIGCWWIGRTSIVAEFKDKAKAYIIGGAIIAGGTWGGFYVLGPSDYELDWKPYSNTLLADLREEGKPIFIDFTGPG